MQSYHISYETLRASHFSYILDEIAEELISCKIFTDAQKVEPGVWTGDIDTTRVFNHDETPQFINFGVDATQSGLAYAARGESCKKMLRENRESVAICPVVSLAGMFVQKSHILMYFAFRDETSTELETSI